LANYVYIATSLDGFIATKDGGIDWLMETPNPDNSDYGYAEFINRVDAIIMGRNSYEKVLTFGEWPYNKKVFILSNTLKSLSENMINKAEIINGDLKNIISQLANRGFLNLYIDGGKVIQSFLNENLIDELIITRIPILLGEGIPLFGKLSKQIKLTHTKTETLNEQLVKSHYTLKRI